MKYDECCCKILIDSKSKQRKNIFSFQLPTETLEIIVTPLFTCFDDKKTQTVKEVGHAMATHALCVNKL